MKDKQKNFHTENIYRFKYLIIKRMIFINWYIIHITPVVKTIMKANM